MPKLIDHTAREIEVAEAAWRVASRLGVRGVSVRNVAAEAGIATASLRRAFPSQSALLAYCLDLIRERAATRIAALGEVTDVDSACALLNELLPLDPERRLEAEVQFALGGAAGADPAIRPAADAAHDGVARACRHVARALAGREDVPEEDVSHLHAVLDGLALHLVRQDPDASGNWAVAILRRHLTALF